MEFKSFDICYFSNFTFLNHKKKRHGKSESV
jgi:hypothetical protein